MSNKQKLLDLMKAGDISSIKQAIELNKVLNLLPTQKLFDALDAEHPYVIEELFENVFEIEAINNIFDKIRKKYGGANSDSLAGFFPIDTGSHLIQQAFYMFIEMDKLFSYSSSSPVSASIKKLSDIEKDIRSGIASAKGISLAGEVLMFTISDKDILFEAKLNVDLDFFISRL